MTAVDDAALDRVLRDDEVRMSFQPIVRLDNREIVAFEALVRGPAGSPLESAASLLAAAYRAGRVAELDWAARASACRTALAAGLSRLVPLFLNIEPMALDTECPADVRREIDAAYSNCQIVLEVTERSLDRDPCSLLVGVDRIRETAQGLAIDDVGANARTLSMLTLLEPELVKLDFGIVHAGPSPDVVRTLDCVYADSERRRAIVLAEGIETAEQANLARSMGATLGQGRYFGWPGPLPTNLPRPREPVQIQPQKLLTANRPFDAAQGLQSRRATASLLAPLGARVGHCSVDIYNSAALVALLPNAELYDAADKDHFEDLARQGVLTGVIGPGVSTEPGEGVRGGHVDLDDTELNGQWAVVGISSHSATAMLAREIPGSSSEFEFVLTHDRERVAAAARCLLRYIHPVDDATELT